MKQNISSKLSQASTANSENTAIHTATVFGWWRKNVPIEVSYRYWRDVHSIMVCRVPGIYQYRLLQLAPICNNLGIEFPRVDFTLPDRDQPHGVAEMLFLTQDDRQTFGQNSLNTDYVFKDEQNLCDRNVTRSALGANAHTYVDRTRTSILNGEPPFPSFMLCIQPHYSLRSEQFRQQMIKQIADVWSQNATVLRLRLHLLEPYNENENSPCVSHNCTTTQQYRAWIELCITEPAILTALLASSDLAQVIRSLHIFPISAYYTMVYNSNLTEVGLRGFPAVQTILAAGADLQRQPDLLKALYGDFGAAIVLH